MTAKNNFKERYTTGCKENEMKLKETSFSGTEMTHGGSLISNSEVKT
jgi:hypothetical protein